MVAKVKVTFFIAAAVAILMWIVGCAGTKPGRELSDIDTGRDQELEERPLPYDDCHRTITEHIIKLAPQLRGQIMCNDWEILRDGGYWDNFRKHLCEKMDAMEENIDVLIQPDGLEEYLIQSWKQSADRSRTTTRNRANTGNSRYEFYQYERTLHSYEQLLDFLFDEDGLNIPDLAERWSADFSELETERERIRFLRKKARRMGLLLKKCEKQLSAELAIRRSVPSYDRNLLEEHLQREISLDQMISNTYISYAIDDRYDNIYVVVWSFEDHAESGYGDRFRRDIQNGIAGSPLLKVNDTDSTYFADLMTQYRSMNKNLDKAIIDLRDLGRSYRIIISGTIEQDIDDTLYCKVTLTMRDIVLHTRIGTDPQLPSLSVKLLPLPPDTTQADTSIQVPPDTIVILPRVTAEMISLTWPDAIVTLANSVASERFSSNFFTLKQAGQVLRINSMIPRSYSAVFDDNTLVALVYYDGERYIKFVDRTSGSVCNLEDIRGTGEIIFRYYEQ